MMIKETMKEGVEVQGGPAHWILHQAQGQAHGLSILSMY